MSMRMQHGIQCMSDTVTPCWLQAARMKHRLTRHEVDVLASAHARVVMEMVAKMQIEPSLRVKNRGQFASDRLAELIEAGLLSVKESLSMLYRYALRAGVIVPSAQPSDDED